jgi:hypothetical protein
VRHDLDKVIEYMGPCDVDGCDDPGPFYKIEDAEIRCIAHLDVPSPWRIETDD